MERCPTCKARLKSAVICPRCQTDLNRVFKINERAEFLCQYAIARLEQQNIKPAVWAIKEALLLQRNKLVLATQQFIVKRLEQQAVANLTHNKQALAIETLELSLSLKKTPFALALHEFIKQQDSETHTKECLAENIGLL
ncbi:MAG: hypothetical protein GQ569_03640 [Methylococcaceae bacterium]|nr:hypothetical protein [Methylococcaceae bacterium]